MMKHFLTIVLLSIAVAGWSQNPFSYQAVAIDPMTKKPIANQTISLQIELVDGNNVLYSEEHTSVTTSEWGKFSLAIGTGVNPKGSFDINYTNGNITLVTYIDLNNGTAFVKVGETPIYSNPNASFATKSTRADTALFVKNLVLNDDDPNNELQSIKLSADTIYLSQGGFVKLPAYNSYDGDSSASNEIQTLSLAGRKLRLSQGGGQVNLFDGDSSASNEIQFLTKTDSMILLSNGGSVLLADDDNSNEIQFLSKTGNRVSLTNGGSIVLIDDDNANELQFLTVSNDTLYLSNGNYVLLKKYLDNTDNQQLSRVNDSIYLSNGGVVGLPKDQVFDGDSSAINELQSITISHDSIFLTNGGFVRLPNDEVYDGDSSDTNEIQVLSLANDSLHLSNGHYVLLNKYLDNTDNQQLSRVNDSIYLSNGGVVGLPKDHVFDGDSSSTNELQALTLLGDTLFLSKAGYVLIPTTSDSSYFERNAHTLRLSGDYDSTNFVFGSPQIDDDNNYRHDRRFVFYKPQGAFRAGAAFNKEWNRDSLGSFSAAFGLNTKAVGSYGFAVGSATQSRGQGAVAMGVQTEATGSNSLAAGINTEANGTSSIALGSSSEADGNVATSIGFLTKATGNYALATGNATVASGSNSVAMGTKTKATGSNATAIGDRSIASGSNSIALGQLDTSSAIYTISAGSQSAATSTSAVAIGYRAKAKNDYAIAMGDEAKATGYGAVSIGRLNQSSGQHAVSFGYSSQASGNESFAAGNATKAEGNYSTTFGYQAEAKGNYSVSMGNNTIASGNSAVSFGSGTRSNGAYALATGLKSVANGEASMALGNNTYVNSAGGLAIGNYNDTIHGLNPTSAEALCMVGNGTYSMFSGTFRSNAFTVYENGNVEINEAYVLPNYAGNTGQVLVYDGNGKTNWKSYSDFSLWEETNNLTRLKNRYSDFLVGDTSLDHKSGSETKMFYDDSRGAFRIGRIGNKNWNEDSIGFYSFAVGNNAKAKKHYDIAMGDEAIASGQNSVAIGNRVSATEAFSLAMGYRSESSGQGSVAIGFGVKSSSSRGVALGQYNVDEPRMVLAVGDGNSSQRRNVFQIKKLSSSSSSNSVFKMRGSIQPFEDDVFDLGSSTLRWDDVYATNGVINTSDTTQKVNMRDLEYGLNEVLKIKTISYHWKHKPMGKAKIGFNAQNLLEVLPEVVVSETEVVDETTGAKSTVPAETLGVYYSDIIPVLTKAIQEQQQQIEELKKEISILKAQK
ncbi:MAG: tail fiber domain-containing protein [Bacteroidia bacterium]|nr:tail fiber domain-containing protein [Bacteroidia bacterium]